LQLRPGLWLIARLGGPAAVVKQFRCIDVDGDRPDVFNRIGEVPAELLILLSRRTR
jgi:hypothetical protein